MSPAADKGSWQGELKPSVRSSGRNGAHFILMAIAFARTEELKNISEVVRRHRPEIGIESRRRVRYRLAEASDPERRGWRQTRRQRTQCGRDHLTIGCDSILMPFNTNNHELATIAGLSNPREYEGKHFIDAA